MIKVKVDEYILMNKNTEVLSCNITESGLIHSINEIYNTDFAPVGLVQNSTISPTDLFDWWYGRSIPASRKGLSEVLENAGINSQRIVMNSLGLSLSDQYWINPGGKLKWQDVNYFNNEFSEDMGDLLLGEKKYSLEMDLNSPDNTSEGMLKKRWKIIDKKRLLIKGGTPENYQNPFNEKFSSCLLNSIGIKNHVEYDIIFDKDMPYSICENFVDENTEFVTAYQISKTLEKDEDTTKYQHFNKCCRKLNIPGMQEHLDKMLTFDFLVANTDRHMRNFGAIRNVETLEFLKPAPVFDNESSLWMNTPIIMMDQTYNNSKPFENVHEKQIELVSSLNGMDFKILDTNIDTLRDILDGNPFMDDKLEKKKLILANFEKQIEKLESYCFS